MTKEELQDLYIAIQNKKISDLTARIEALEAYLKEPSNGGAITLTKFVLSLNKMCKDHKLDVETNDNIVKSSKKRYNWATDEDEMYN